MSERYAELRRLALAATPGEWTASETYPGGDSIIHAPESPWQLFYVNGLKGDFPHKINAAYLVAAQPKHVLALLADNKAMREALAAVEAEYEDGYGLRCIEQVRAALASVLPDPKENKT